MSDDAEIGARLAGAQQHETRFAVCGEKNHRVALVDFSGSLFSAGTG
jgi:hypothetical protein